MLRERNINQVKQKMRRLSEKYKRIKSSSESMQNQNSLKIISWNVDGGLNPQYNNNINVVNVINEASADWLLIQEAAGLKGGYKKSNQHNIAELKGMDHVATDEFGTTVISAKRVIDNFIKIPLPDDLFGSVNPKKIFHVTAVVVILKTEIRNRNALILVNVYRSPSKEAIMINKLEVLFKYIHQFMDDQNPNMLICGDFNIWSELIGSPLELRTMNKNKFEDGDKLFEVMNKYRVSSNHLPVFILYKIGKYILDTLLVFIQCMMTMNITYNKIPSKPKPKPK